MAQECIFKLLFENEKIQILYCLHTRNTLSGTRRYKNIFIGHPVHIDSGAMARKKLFFRWELFPLKSKENDKHITTVHVVLCANRK